MTDRPTDGQMDGPTNKAGCSVACARLKMIATRHIFLSLFSPTVYTFPLFFSYSAKIVFHNLFKTFFRIGLLS